MSKLLTKLKKIVCIGGGNAMPKAVLQGLKKEAVEISAICATLDSGGSAGRLRRDYKIVSPGDIRRALIALANTSPVIENLFNYRFQTGELRGHNFANLFITALELSSNNYNKALREMKRILNISHQVLPATIERANLYALLENGKIISGEANIDLSKYKDLKIKKVFLRPVARTYPQALRAVKRADLIVIGPGDLYSSLVQVLLTRGFAQAFQKSQAKKVYICNLMTKRGETNNFTVLDFTREVEKYLGSQVDYVIYNNFIPKKEIIAAYKKLHPELSALVKIDLNLGGAKFIGKNLLLKNSIEHSHKKLAEILLKL